MSEEIGSHEARLSLTQTEIIEEPVLRGDQNLYDQQPFTEVITQACEKYTDTDPEIIRTALTYKVSQMAGPDAHIWISVEQANGIDDMLFRRNKSLGSSLRKYMKGKGVVIPSDLGASLSHDFDELLEQYPYIYDYLEKHLYSSRGYGYNGDRFQRHGKYIPEETYVSWISKKLKAERNAVLLGIEEIFPQQLGGNTNPSNRKIKVVIRK